MWSTEETKVLICQEYGANTVDISTENNWYIKFWKCELSQKINQALVDPKELKNWVTEASKQKFNSSTSDLV